MSKHPTNNSQKKVQYIVKKGTKDFDDLEIIEKIFPYPNRSDSIKSALAYITNLITLTNADNLEELNKNISINS